MDKFSTFVGTLGILYIVLGLFGLFSTILTTILIIINKKLRNPSYTFMVNHLIADALCMIPISLYTGMCMIFNTKFYPWLERMMSVFVDLGWYPSGLLLITIGITRLVSIRFNSYLKRIFNKRINTIILMLIWIIYIFMTCGYFFPIYITSYLSFDAFTWYYDDQTMYGKFMTIYYSVHGFSTSIVMTAINFIILIFIKNKLNGINVNVRSNANKKREIKLFIQCLITGTFYSFTSVTYSTLYLIGSDFILQLEYYFCFHLIWIINHGLSGVIYFCYNKALIRMVKSFFGRQNGSIAFVTNVRCGTTRLKMDTRM